MIDARSVPDEGASGVRAAGTRHVVCFEDAGACTLERIAREARVGDSVLVLGPMPLVARLREFGLPADIPIERRGRSAGSWSMVDRHATPEGVPAARAYGVQAWRVVGAPVVRAPVPPELPPPPKWPDGRRARIRRELGLAPHDFAVLLGCERPETVDLSFIARAAGMALVGGLPLRFVLSPATPRWQDIDAFLREAAQCKGMVVDERAERPWELLPALDACILDRDGALDRPDVCLGWRSQKDLPRDATEAGDAVSAMPALWAIACGVSVFAHQAIDLGVHASHPLVTRFDRNVAQLARAMQERV